MICVIVCNSSYRTRGHSNLFYVMSYSFFPYVDYNSVIYSSHYLELIIDFYIHTYIHTCHVQTNDKFINMEFAKCF